MDLFTRRIGYDRKRLLERAAALERGRRWRHSLRLYRQILAAEPDCIEIHGRVAPLLARSGRQDEAWDSYRRVAAALASASDKSGERKILRKAIRAIPLEPDAYRRLALLERARNRPGDALKVLHQGSETLARKGRRGMAILLLREAREIDSWNPMIVLDLCRLLARDRQAAEALFLLDQLEPKVQGEALQALRFRLWAIEPSLRHTWRWLKLIVESRNQRRASVAC